MQFAHASRGFVAQSQVDGQVWTNLEVILDEELRILDAHVRDGLVGRLPVFYVAQQKIRETRTAGSVVLLSVLTGERKLPGIHVAPGSRIPFPHQNFYTEVKAVPPLDQ